MVPHEEDNLLVSEISANQKRELWRSCFYHIKSKWRIFEEDLTNINGFKLNVIWTFTSEEILPIAAMCL